MTPVSLVERGEKKKKKRVSAQGCHPITQQPSRAVESVLDAVQESPSTINHTPWKMPNENTQKATPAATPTGDLL